MPSILKIRLILMAACIVFAAAASLYLKGVDAGIAQVDEESLAAYTHFAKQMQVETHRPKAKPAKAATVYTASVWAAIDKH